MSSLQAEYCIVQASGKSKQFLFCFFSFLNLASYLFFSPFSLAFNGLEMMTIEQKMIPRRTYVLF